MDQKDNRIVIRVSTSDKMKLKEYALKHNTTLSEMVLVAMLKLIAAEETINYKRGAENEGWNNTTILCVAIFRK